MGNKFVDVRSIDRCINERMITLMTPDYNDFSLLFKKAIPILKELEDDPKRMKLIDVKFFGDEFGLHLVLKIEMISNEMPIEVMPLLIISNGHCPVCHEDLAMKRKNDGIYVLKPLIEIMEHIKSKNEGPEWKRMHDNMMKLV